MVDLSFFWHMHQPDYRNGEGVMRMPWVFLHAIKDYYDMPWILSRFPRLKASFNVTPPLIEQLLLYEKEGVESDHFLSLWAKSPQSLSSDEYEWVLKICRSSQFETMVKPLPRYAELYEKKRLNADEYVEFEVLFMLAWCGNYLRKDNEHIATLLKKGRGYDARDKALLIETLLSFIPKILPFYGELLKKGQVSLATTPLNHPILPLLLDMNNAKIANPKTAIPSDPLSLEGDAKAQVERAVVLYKELFGLSPTGFWPAEGAVDEKSVAIYKSHGIRWIATDEAILFRSLGCDTREALYRRYGYDNLFIAFRDHFLSDLIGFTYRFWDAEKAAEDFVSHLHTIGERYGDAAISVILDGENAWEFYRNNGYDFFDALYTKLDDTQWCRTVTMDETAEKGFETLPKIHPGSWIYSTFDTWVGHPQKNTAWERIYQTKRDYLRHEGRLDERQKAAITDHFLAAECSDWFWWYGDDHFTDYADEFDRLFRNHLIEIYRLMDVAPPANLFQPIAGERDLHALMSEPKFPIHPTIDGRISSFFEWLGSGMMDEGRLFSTMDKVRGPIETIYWGENGGAVYLRLDGDMEKLKRSGVLHIYIDELDTPIDLAAADAPLHGDISFAVGDIVEIALSKRIFRGMNKIHLRIEVELDGQVVQTLPGVSELGIDLQDDFSENWFV
ncbi:glycoside hydrolase family 57 protein [Hydrogenimonas cancrithermarum]|uniref:Glycoside hydrolase n=1 Tax=Hydrogenimonas cancrithermarum TaxID=2993563 RepID=A0ABN6WRF5_9BACT|nr:glycoside hydrolase family 57 protein [Hydrogenimonas cancrithermarum]BDY11739.1 glycoside hydrolase [Hydrogenimonas cancrithermarum]